MAEFKVQIVTPILKKYFLHMLDNENWDPAVNEIECFLAFDPTSLYVGELNGEPMAIAALFKYGDNYRHFGCYIVDKAYRGKGYGLKITEEVLRQSSPVNILSLYAVPDMVAKYQKYFNCNVHWIVEKHVVNVLKAIDLLKDTSSRPSFDIKAVRKVNLQALCNYDAAVFGYRRDKFLECFLNGTIAQVVVNSNGDIVGYAVARLVFNQDHSYKVGPIFCESLEIAKSLLKVLFQEIAKSKKNLEQTVAIINIPRDVNPSANDLARFLGGNVIMNCNFMSSSGLLPKSDFKRWFGVTTCEAG